MYNNYGNVSIIIALFGLIYFIVIVEINAIYLGYYCYPNRGRAAPQPSAGARRRAAVGHPNQQFGESEFT